MFRKYRYLLCIAVSSFLLRCFPEDPPLPDPLAKPTLEFAGLLAIEDDNGSYTEAIHLRWIFKKTSEMPISSFTLFRKLPDDSLFDVFSGSRGIPADTVYFFDELKEYTFPENSIDSIAYRIVAVDTFGRSGDTSEICIVLVAPQPSLFNLNSTTGYCSWESWIRGGVCSWCRIWSSKTGVDWTSEEKTEFPFTDKPASFVVYVPDSLVPMAAGRWNYALFIKANESHSLKTGVMDVW